MEARQMDRFTSTVPAGSSNLGLVDLKKAYRKLLKAGRYPVFVPHPLLQEHILHGELIDRILTHIQPGYNPKIHKGYLVPEKYSDLLKDLYG